MYVHDVGLFLIVDIFEDTPCSSIVWKVCEEHGYSYEWVSGQQPRLTKQDQTNYMQNGDFNSRVIVFFEVGSQFSQELVLFCSVVVLVSWFQFDTDRPHTAALLSFLSSALFSLL